MWIENDSLFQQSPKDNHNIKYLPFPHRKLVIF